MTLTWSRERWSKLSPNLQGALWLLLSCLGFSVMATFVKFAAREVSPFEITFFRCFFGLLVAGARSSPGTASARCAPGISACMPGAASSARPPWAAPISASASMPLAAYNALSFSKPLFAIVLAVIVLHETVRWRRWAATIVGFLGVLVMMRPGTEAFDPNGLFALGDALSIAILITVLKKLPAYERPLAMLFYFGLVSSPIALMPALPGLDLAEHRDLGAAGRHRRHRRAVAILVDHGDSAPAKPRRSRRSIIPGCCSRPCSASLSSAEVPDVWTLAGAGLIVASTIYIARREAKIGARSRQGSGGDRHLFTVL